MKGLVNYIKETEDIKILVMLDGTIGSMEDVEYDIISELQDNFEEHLDFIKNDDILLFDTDEEFCILELVDEINDCPDSCNCAVLYEGRRYTVRTLEDKLINRSLKSKGLSNDE